MSFEFESNLIKVREHLFEDADQNMVDGDLIIPDSKPDIISIINQSAQVKIVSQEMHRDMVVLRGIVKFSILYMSDDPSRFVCSVEQSVNFDQTMELSKNGENAKCYTDCRVEHVDCSILNGRKLNLKAILVSSVKVVDTKEINAISSVDNAEYQIENIVVQNDVDFESADEMLTFEGEVPFGMPAIKEILRTDAYIKDKEVRVTGNKSIVSGNIEIKSLYVPDIGEDFAEYITNEFNFSIVVDVPSVCDDYNVLVNLDGISAEVKKDDDGDDRIISYDVFLKLNPYSSEQESIQIISDAYATKAKLELEKEKVKILNISGESSTQSTVRETIDLPTNNVVQKIYNVALNPIITDIKAENDKVYIDGLIEARVICFCEGEKPLDTYKQDIPFSNIVEIKGVTSCMRPEAIVEIENFSYNLMNSSQVELKITLGMNIRVMNEEYYDVITKVEEMPLDAKRETMPSMTVYYVQNGDTLWGIAKKYLVTVSELISINRIDNPSALDVGQQLIIPKAS